MRKSAFRLKSIGKGSEVTGEAEEVLQSIAVKDSSKVVVRRKYRDRPTSMTLEVDVLPWGVYATKVETTKGTCTKKLILK